MSKLGLLPGPAAALVTSAVARLKQLSYPARLGIATSAAFALILASILVYRETHEPYAVLFAQLEQDDAAGIVAKLRELKVPYRVEGGGSTVEVPESKVAEVRMDLVTAGLPRGGGVGFESFDKLRLGATEFEQRVLYRRALEGELARTIGSLGAIQSARVHIVMPEKSVFVQRAEAASASVLLRLRSGRSLGPSEVRGIVSLTAAAVPGLIPDHIAVVTSDGQMLKKPRAAGADGSSSADEDQTGEQRALEAQLEDRARSLLEKVVGPGHVDVRVTAELDPARVEHVEDHYDPSRTALRSEEQTRERTGVTVDDTVGGVPGAESNLLAPGGASRPAPPASGSAAAASPAPPPANPTPARALAAAAAPSRAGDQPFRESHTRNFEVDHVSDKRLVSAGALRRIGVAVIVDGVPHFEDGKRIVAPRDRVELDRFSALVRSAVGANDARGDSVTVESVPFEESAVAAETVPVEKVASAAPNAARSIRPYLPAIAAAALLVLVGVAVVIKRSRADLRSATAAAVLAPVIEAPRLDDAESAANVRTRALERAAQDPATAALVLRLWLGTTDAEIKG